MKKDTFDKSVVEIFVDKAMKTYFNSVNTNNVISIIYDGLNTEAGIMYLKTNKTFLKTAIEKGIFLLKQVDGSNQKDMKNIRRAIVSFLLTLQQSDLLVDIPSFPMYLEDFDEEDFDEEFLEEDELYEL